VIKPRIGKKVYLEIFGQVESLKKWMESKNKHNDVVEQRISSTLEKFNNLESHKKSYEGEIIKWPTLSNKST